MESVKRSRLAEYFADMFYHGLEPLTSRFCMEYRLIGLILSIMSIQIYNLIAGAAATINWAAGCTAMIFCVVIGIVFGGYPAAKASRLQPIDALRNS